MRILVAEDDAPLATSIAKAVKSEDHITEIATNGEDALQCLVKTKYDLLILDLHLPVISGREVLAKARARDPGIFIFILTPIHETAERVAWLDAGMDYYLTKPVSIPELVARVRATDRRLNNQRISSQEQNIRRIADLELNYMHRTVKRHGRPIELTPREFKLLEYFMCNPNRHLTRNNIIQHVWKLAPDTRTNVVDVYVNYLRKKIDEDFKVKLIRTVRGIGYEFGAVDRAEEHEARIS